MMKPIPDYGDHFTLEEFIKHVNEGLFVDHDGSGYYATETEVNYDEPVYPSEIEEGIINRNYTHVMWFNK